MGLGGSKVNPEGEAKLKEENEKLKKELQQIQDQLAKEMHTNVSANETSFENVQIQARPMKIGEEYANFCTDAWLEAKSELDDECEEVKEIDKIKFLCYIIMETADYTEKCKEKVWKNITFLLNEPHAAVAGDWTTTRIEKMAKDSKKTTKDVEISVSDYFRKTGESVNIEPLVQDVIAHIEEKTKDEQLKESLQNEQMFQMKAYINQTCRICWKMALQRPPMHFSTPEVGALWSTVKDKYTLDPQYGSDHSHPQAIVHAYLHPILFHGKTPYGRTKVLVGPEEMEFKGD